MVNVSAQELRDSTREVLERVAAGETFTITLDRRPVAELRPVGGRPRWVSAQEFVRRLGKHQADPDLTRDVRRLAPGTTDDLPW